MSQNHRNFDVAFKCADAKTKSGQYFRDATLGWHVAWRRPCGGGGFMARRVMRGVSVLDLLSWLCSSSPLAFRMIKRIVGCSIPRLRTLRTFDCILILSMGAINSPD
ncbi:hypothetical protein DYB35_012900 [Aphanomyces astaci]|uniref:Uncharacterized protein n=1 Tax=Aphanomyces astaci TaxID=112090 RepID=A0A3R6XM30_APHAT|nr:hypothetical protein DYB35_012900 [Aphanomyces astaci]